MPLEVFAYLLYSGVKPSMPWICGDRPVDFVIAMNLKLSTQMSDSVRSDSDDDTFASLVMLLRQTVSLYKVPVRSALPYRWPNPRNSVEETVEFAGSYTLLPF